MHLAWHSIDDVFIKWAVHLFNQTTCAITLKAFECMIRLNDEFWRFILTQTKIEHLRARSFETYSLKYEITAPIRTLKLYETNKNDVLSLINIFSETLEKITLNSIDVCESTMIMDALLDCGNLKEINILSTLSDHFMYKSLILNYYEAFSNKGVLVRGKYSKNIVLGSYLIMLFPENVAKTLIKYYK